MFRYLSNLETYYELGRKGYTPQLLSSENSVTHYLLQDKVAGMTIKTHVKQHAIPEETITKTFPIVRGQMEVNWKLVSLTEKTTNAVVTGTYVGPYIMGKLISKTSPREIAAKLNRIATKFAS